MSRLEKFRHQMKEADIDGFLITQPQNRRYLSGFTGSSGTLIITPERQVITTDFRYYEQVRQQCPDWELAEVGYDFVGEMLELLRGLELGAQHVGFEAGHVSAATLHAWERALLGRLVLVHTTGFVENLRMQKEPAEIEIIKKAAALADQTVAYIMEMIEPGLTEKEVAWAIEKYMRSEGADALSFEVIVASGPNAALPHARPTDRRLQSGESIILDFGCIVDGYCSDITRSFCLGSPADDQYIAIWNLVAQAQQIALQGARAGLTGKAVDKLARDIIEEAGYGDQFQHGLGHGVGLAVHEEPRFSYHYPHEIPAGSVVTVEPGIYLPGWGGVRLEDMVVAHEDSVELLTHSPKVARVDKIG